MPDLREFSYGRRGVRDKLEAILRRWRKWSLRWRRRHSHIDRSGGFDEIPPEGGAVAERPLLFDTVPMYSKRLDHRAYKSQRACRIETVGYSEDVEGATQVPEVKNCLALIQIDLDASFRDLRSPEDQSRRNTGVVRMRAQG